jgi:exopolysaccharide/PEP-CTERM locus tyrosine autokinase
MSKIQKALQHLRESRKNGVADDAVAAGMIGHPQTAQQNNRAAAPRQAAQRRPRPNVRLPLDYEEARALEQLPDKRISIDLQALFEAGLIPSEEHSEQIAQQFRRIKRPVINLAFGEGQPEGENSNLIMVASAMPKSGKTFCSVNLATSIARERDIGAVLVDADVLKPNISRALGLQNRVGLIDHLLDPSISIDNIILQSDLHDIVVIPAGRQHDDATELLSSRRMGRFVATLSQRFRNRAIVVDTPPLLLTNEAHVLAEHMGQIVMIIEAGVSTQETVLQALDSLNRDKPINVILNKARGGVFGTYGAEGYGYYSAPQKGYNDVRTAEE